MQLHSGVTLAETAIESSNYQSALRTGGYYDDLEIQTIISLVSRIRQSSMPQVIYDIGAKDGAYALALDHHLNRSKVIKPTRIYSYEICHELMHMLKVNTKESPNITPDFWSNIGKYEHQVVDLIRIDECHPLPMIKSLKTPICNYMPVVLIRMDAHRATDVAYQMMDFGYNYYALSDNPNCYNRVFVHQLERVANKVVETQKKATYLFVVPGGHPSIRCTTMLPWHQFIQELAN